LQRSPQDPARTLALLVGCKMMLNRLAQRMRCSKWGEKVAEVVEPARSPEESVLERWLHRGASLCLVHERGVFLKRCGRSIVSTRCTSWSKL